MSETAFKLGDVVETSKGAKFWGRIVSLDDDPDSHPGATVMAIHPEFDGVKHVYPLKQLRLREDATPSLPASAEGGETTHRHKAQASTSEEMVERLRRALQGAKVVIGMMVRPEGLGQQLNEALDHRTAAIDAALKAETSR